MCNLCLCVTQLHSRYSSHLHSFAALPKLPSPVKRSNVLSRFSMTSSSSSTRPELFARPRRRCRISSRSTCGAGSTKWGGLKVMQHLEDSWYTSCKNHMPGPDTVISVITLMDFIDFHSLGCWDLLRPHATWGSTCSTQPQGWCSRATAPCYWARLESPCAGAEPLAKRRNGLPIRGIATEATTGFREPNLIENPISHKKHLPGSSLQWLLYRLYPQWSQLSCQILSARSGFTHKLHIYILHDAFGILRMQYNYDANLKE